MAKKGNKLASSKLVLTEWTCGTAGSKNVREMNGRELVLSDFGVEDIER